MYFDDQLDEALRQTADLFDSTPEAVLRNIQEVIDEAFSSPDPEVQERWSQIPYTGNHPDAREVMLLLAATLQTPERSSNLH